MRKLSSVGNQGYGFGFWDADGRLLSLSPNGINNEWQILCITAEAFTGNVPQ